jgi:WD40 repeat protein
MHTGALLHRDHQGAVYALSPSGDGAVLSAGSDGFVLRWHPREPGVALAMARLPAPVLALLPAGHRLYVGTLSGELFMLDLAAKRTVQRLEAHRGGVHALAELDGGRLAVAGADGCLTIWGASDSGLVALRRIPLIDGKLRALAMDAGRTQLAVAASDGTVRVLETDLFNETATWDAHEGGAAAVCFHPAKPVLLSGGKDGHACAWDLHSGRRVLRLPLHGATIYAMAFAPAGDLLATASRDRTAKLWSAADLSAQARLDARQGGHSHSVNALLWLGRTVITSGDDARIILWDTGAGSQNG